MLREINTLYTSPPGEIPLSRIADMIALLQQLLDSEQLTQKHIAALQKLGLAALKRTLDDGDEETPPDEPAP